MKQASKQENNQGVKAQSSKPVRVFFGLNYKYLKIYHESIKHVILLGKKIEIICEKI